MKVLLFIDNLGSGGAQRQMVTIAMLLKRSKIDVSFLVYGSADFFLDVLLKDNISVYMCEAQSYIYRIIKIRKYIRKGKYDAVISFMDVPNFLNNLAAVGTNKKWKVITSERSSKENYLISIQGKIFGWFQRYSDAIVCNSHNAKSMWEKYFPQYKNKITVIYNPVILPEITSAYIPKRNGKLHIVIAASYQYLKNPIGLIQAIALMSETEREKIEINWYGRAEVTNGDTRAYDESVKIIIKNNLQDIIHLNKPTKDIANIMNEADAIALFSELEGLPNAICEGMMIGKPIIMTRVSDYAQLVDDSNGLLGDWNNPESIKNILVQALDFETYKIIEMGNNSNKKANILFSTEIIIEKWLRLIK